MASTVKMASLVYEREIGLDELKTNLRTYGQASLHLSSYVNLAIFEK